MKTYLTYFFNALGKKTIIILIGIFILMNCYIMFFADIKGLTSSNKTYIPVELYKYVQLFWGVAVSVVVIYLLSLDYRYKFNEINITTIGKVFNKFQVIKFSLITVIVLLLSAILNFTLYYATEKNAMLLNIPMDVTLIEALGRCSVVVFFIIAFSFMVTNIINEVSFSMIIVLISLIIIGYKINLGEYNQYKVYIDLFATVEPVFINKIIYLIMGVSMMCTSFIVKRIR